MKTEEYLKKIYTMLIVVLVISIMSLLIGLVNYSNTKGTTNNNSSTTTNNGSSTNNYDVSMFNEVSITWKFSLTSYKIHIFFIQEEVLVVLVLLSYQIYKQLKER